jgi:hypothetical protein
LPHGAGDGKVIFATLSLWRTSSRPSSSFWARFAMFCAATAFVAFAPILAACVISAPAFFSALARSRRRRFSSVARASRYFFQPRL